MTQTATRAVAPKAIRANLADPSRLGVLADLREVLDELVQYRFLLQQLTLRDIRLRYKQAIMGFFWAVFMPVLIVLAGLLIKYAMARMSGTELQASSVATLAIKALPWAFFVGGMQFSTASLITNHSLVTKIYFPREVLPLSSVAAQCFDSGIGALALMLVLPFLGIQLSAALFWVPVLIVMLIGMTAAAALFLSSANLFFRDVKYIVQVLLTFGIFFTPVFFEPATFGELGSRLLMLNPIAPILEGFRLAIVEGHNLMVPLTVTSGGESVLAWSPWHLLYAGSFATAGLAATAVIFHRSEQLFAEYV